jgi:hypothetical protein
VDDLCDPYDSVASGFSKRVYDWRIHSHPAGHRNCRCFDQNYSRAKPFVILTAKYLQDNKNKKSFLNLDKKPNARVPFLSRSLAGMARLKGACLVESQKPAPICRFLTSWYSAWYLLDQR